MHSRSKNTAIKGWSWPNFWANLASFSLRAAQALSSRGWLATTKH
jgi:hypothetical protein